MYFFGQWVSMCILNFNYSRLLLESLWQFTFPSAMFKCACLHMYHWLVLLMFANLMSEKWIIVLISFFITINEISIFKFGFYLPFNCLLVYFAHFLKKHWAIWLFKKSVYGNSLMLEIQCVCHMFCVDIVHLLFFILVLLWCHAKLSKCLWRQTFLFYFF